MITEQCPEGFYAEESKGGGCDGCFFQSKENKGRDCLVRDCEPHERHDGKSVVFKRIETPPKAKVVTLPASTSFTPEQALESMKSLEPADVLCIGYDKDGCTIIRSSKMTRAEALFLLKKAEQWVMDGE